MFGKLKSLGKKGIDILESATLAGQAFSLLKEVRGGRPATDKDILDAVVEVIMGDDNDSLTKRVEALEKKVFKRRSR